MADRNTEQQERENKLRRLWTIIKKTTDREAKEKLINALDEQTLVDLRKMGNPYGKVAVTADKGARVLAFHVINLTELYQRRFAVTGLIGFLYRMLDEYKVETDKISENDPKFAIPYNQKIRELERTRPAEILLEQFRALKAEIEAGAQGPDLEEKVRQSYLLRAKIYNFRRHWAQEDRKVVLERWTRAAEDLASLRDELTNYENLHRALSLKLERRRAAEEAKSGGTVLVQEGKKTTDTLTIDDMQRSIASFEGEVKAKGDVVRILKEEKIPAKEAEYADLDKEKTLLDTAIEDLSTKIATLRREYEGVQPKKAPAKGTKATKRQLIDQILGSEELTVESYEPTPDDYDALAEEVKRELGITETAEEHQDKVAAHIRTFLDSYLQYNPDNHVRMAYKPNYEDPTRTPLEKTHAKDTENKIYERSVIPPADTFHRLDRYIENNYEPLRQACDDIYAERSDVEFAIAPLEIFSGSSRDEAMAQFDKYKRKYADEFDADIRAADFNNWSLLASWQENREVRDFYTEKTEIIKRIVDQHKEDSRIGAAMTKHRGEEKRRKDKKSGQNNTMSEEAHKLYLKQNPTAIAKHGAKPLSEIGNGEIIPGAKFGASSDIIRPGELRRNDGESSNQEVEVNVSVIKPVAATNRRVRGRTEQFHLNIASEKLPEGGMSMSTVGEFHKKMAKENVE